jgi:hypothetical protein
MASPLIHIPADAKGLLYKDEEDKPCPCTQGCSRSGCYNKISQPGQFLQHTFSQVLEVEKSMVQVLANSSLFAHVFLLALSAIVMREEGRKKVSLESLIRTLIRYESSTFMTYSQRFYFQICPHVGDYGFNMNCGGVQTSSPWPGASVFLWLEISEEAVAMLNDCKIHCWLWCRLGGLGKAHWEEGHLS